MKSNNRADDVLTVAYTVPICGSATEQLARLPQFQAARPEEEGLTQRWKQYSNVHVRENRGLVCEKVALMISSHDADLREPVKETRSTLATSGSRWSILEIEGPELNADRNLHVLHVLHQVPGVALLPQPGKGLVVQEVVHRGPANILRAGEEPEHYRERLCAYVGSDSTI